MIVLAMIAVPEFRPQPAGFASPAVTFCLRRAAGRFGSDCKATFYTRRVALGAIDVDSARILDLREHPENKPLLKTNGYAVPGLMAGNFRDRKRRKVFCLVTAPSVVVLPLDDDSRMLLSPARPAHLLRSLSD